VVEGTFYWPVKDSVDAAQASKSWCVFELPCAEYIAKLATKLQAARLVVPPHLRSQEPLGEQVIERRVGLVGLFFFG
jgi:hypothetical protein